MLNYKKPTFWIIIIAIVINVLLALVFLMNQKDDKAGDSPEIAFPLTYCFHRVFIVKLQIILLP